MSISVADDAMDVPDDAIHVANNAMDVANNAIDVSTDSNSGVFVPPEICALIIEFGSGFLKQDDLHALAAVSHSFSQESERYLYSQPILWNKEKINKFCTTILSRPDLADRIFKLVLYMPPQTDFQVADLSRITRTLRLAVNLKFLDVFRQSDRGNPPLHPKKGEAMQSWILENHKFKLVMFRNTYFSLATLRPFILSQPTLEILDLKCEGPACLEHAHLPRLKRLSCSLPVLKELAGYRRKIESLSLSAVNSSREADITMMQNLDGFRNTLQSLYITKYTSSPGEGLSIIEFVMAAAMRFLPTLKVLHIADLRWKEGYSDAPFGAFSLLQPFTQLEVLCLWPPFKRPDRPSIPATDSFYSVLNTEVGRLIAATRIMATIPTLKGLYFVTPEYVYVYARIMAGDGSYVTLSHIGPTAAVVRSMLPS